MGDLPQVAPVTGVAQEEATAQPVEDAAELDDENEEGTDSDEE